MNLASYFKHLNYRNPLNINYVKHYSSISLKEERTKELLDKIIRVDHAGEYGAVQIYLGQLAVLKNSPKFSIIKNMLEQEEFHLSTMENKIQEYRVRPTILLPLWNVAGFFLGASTAVMGNEAAMACTVAVETAIGEHYNSQLRDLMSDGKNGQEKHEDLIKLISKFRDEELEHLDTGLANNAEQAPFYKALTFVIKTGCKGAIWLSERI